MKKIMTIAEVELLRLDANDILCTSVTNEVGWSGGSDDEGYGFAPSRYNYRGMATDWDANEDW